MTGTTRTGVLRRTAARMATMALQGMRPGWDAAAAAALASRLVGGVGLPAVLRAGGDAGSEGGRAVLVRSLHASMRSSCPSCPLLAHSWPRSSRLYGRILTPPRSSAPSTVWRAAVRWLEKWPQNKKNNIVLCVPPCGVSRHLPLVSSLLNPRGCLLWHWMWAADGEDRRTVSGGGKDQRWS